MTNSKGPYFHIRPILLLGCGIIFLALVLAYALYGPGELVDSYSLLLGSLHLLLLTSALFIFNKESRGIVYLFVFSNLIIYDQSLFYSYLFPGTGLYSSHVRLTVGDMNSALVYLLGITTASLLGFKAGELFPRRPGKTVTKELFVESNRRLFYIIATIVNLIYFVLSLILFPTMGKVWSDQLIFKILLHFIVFNGLYIYVSVVIMLHPKIVKTRQDKFGLFIVLFSYFLDMLVTGQKGAFMHILLIFLVCKLLFGDYRISRRVAAISVAAVFPFLLIFPLSLAIRGAMFNSKEGLNGMEQAFVEEFRIDYEGGLLKQVQNLSLRLGGMEWFCTVLVREEEFREYFNLTNLVKSTVNTFVPWPGRVFPYLVDVGRAMQIVIFGLNYEDTDFIGGYPMLPGWIYVTFGWFGSIVFMFFWGVVCMAVVRSNLGMIKKLMFVYLFVWSLFLSGDLVTYLKDYAVFLFTLWMIERLMTAPKRSEVRERLAMESRAAL